MSSREIVLWLDERWYQALSSQLKDETLEEKLNGYLNTLIGQLPSHVLEKVVTEIQADERQQEQELAAKQKYSAFRVRENDQDECFRLEESVDIVDASQYVRRYLRREPGMMTDSFAEAFPKREPITAEVFDQMAALHMEKPDKVTGVFDLDFNDLVFSAVHAADGWKTYEMGDVSVAAYHAFRKDHQSKEQRQATLLDVLKGRDIPSAGHLSARDMEPPAGPVM